MLLGVPVLTVQRVPTPAHQQRQAVVHVRQVPIRPQQVPQAVTAVPLGNILQARGRRPPQVAAAVMRASPRLQARVRVRLVKPEPMRRLLERLSAPTVPRVMPPLRLVRRLRVRVQPVLTDNIRGLDRVFVSTALRVTTCLRP